jgi:hypothetical protein
VTREDAIEVGICTLAYWHARDHGVGCVCPEGDEHEIRSAMVIDALIAKGVRFETSMVIAGSSRAQRNSGTRSAAAEW